MLLAMNHLAHVREMARTINTAATNAANAMLTITPTIRILLGTDSVTSHQLESVTDNLIEIVKTDAEKTVYNLTKQITYKLKATPNAGTDEEIKSTCIIVDVYTKNDPNPATQPNTPLPVLIPVRNIPTKAFEIETKNINHLAEALNLMNFMNHILLVNKTTIFEPPTSFTTMIENGEKDKDLWEEILEEIFNKKAVDIKYCGQTVYYLQFGPPHAPHFMGCNVKDQFILASSKKELFSRMSV
jgi:hypothetical protein